MEVECLRDTIGDKCFREHEPKSGECAANVSGTDGGRVKPTTEATHKLCTLDATLFLTASRVIDLDTALDMYWSEQLSSRLQACSSPSGKADREEQEEKPELPSDFCMRWCLT